MERKKLYLINLSSIFMLGCGFTIALVFPKIVIDSLGINNYGYYSVIFGLCLISSLSDFGLIAGLTREIGVLYSKNDFYSINSISKKIIKYISLIGIFLIPIIYFFTQKVNSGLSNIVLFECVLTSCIALLLISITEIKLISVKVASGIVTCNILKSFYYIFYLTVLFIFYYFGILTIITIFISQLISASMYLFLSFFISKKYYYFKTTDKSKNVIIPWKRLFLISTPEQLNRLQSSLSPGIERGVMVGVSGASVVSSYEISQRLSSLASALPSALASPLIALLSGNVAAGKHEVNSLIMKHTDLLIFPIVLLSLSAGLVFINFFAESFYHIDNSSFIYFANIILISTSFNVITASPVAFLQSHNITFPILLKSSFDFIIC